MGGYLTRKARVVSATNIIFTQYMLLLLVELDHAQTAAVVASHYVRQACRFLRAVFDFLPADSAAS